MDKFYNIILVGAGGFIGSILRYLLMLLSEKLIKATVFPYGLLAVNLLGCLAIGLFYGWAETVNISTEKIRLLLVVGVLGSFTTFSAFGYESFSLWNDRSFTAMALNIFLHVLIGLLMVKIGYVITHK